MEESIEQSTFIYLILASMRPENVLDEEMQRRTWALTLPRDTKVLWLRGAEGIKPKLKDQTLWVPSKDSDILRKTILGLNFLFENFDFDYVIRSNVSTYFKVSSFAKVISSIPSKDFLAGYPEQVEKKIPIFGGNAFLSGAALCMPYTTARKLTKINFQEYLGWPDDVAISHYLTKCHTSIYPLNRSNLGYHHLAILNSYIRCKSSTKSQLASARMKFIHDIFVSKSFFKRFFLLFKLQYYEIRMSTFNFYHLGNYLIRCLTFTKSYFLISWQKYVFGRKNANVTTVCNE